MFSVCYAWEAVMLLFDKKNVKWATSRENLFLPYVNRAVWSVPLLLAAWIV